MSDRRTCNASPCITATRRSSAWATRTQCSNPPGSFHHSRCNTCLGNPRDNIPSSWQCSTRSGSMFFQDDQAESNASTLDKAAFWRLKDDDMTTGAVLGRVLLKPSDVEGPHSRLPCCRKPRTPWVRPGRDGLEMRFHSICDDRPRREETDEPPRL